MPKGTEEEQSTRQAALQEATRYAIEVPLKVMKRSGDAFELIKAMAENGNPNSVSDAGVGALCLRSAVMGAYLNVKINAAGLEDREFADKELAEGKELETLARRQEEEILQLVNGKIG